MSFYLQKSNKDITLDAGVRFEGKDPNNYVTFNGGEEWRIIGTFEGSTIGLEPGKQYTKLIRSDYIDYMYGDTESWENSSINQYLNSDYLNSMSDKDKIAKYNNNYGTFYLKSKLRYDVYSDSASDWFLIERELGDYPTGSIKSAIGLMYISDYFYAEYGEGSFPSWLENDYSVEEGEGEYYGEYQYVINTGGNDGYLMYINGGGVNWTETPDSYTVRPVLYLEADTNILKGTGTKADPYVLN